MSGTTTGSECVTIHPATLPSTGMTMPSMISSILVAASKRSSPVLGSTSMIEAASESVSSFAASIILRSSLPSSRVEASVRLTSMSRSMRLRSKG